MKLFQTKTENGIELSQEIVNETSMPVEIDSPYLTLSADRVIAMNKMQLSVHVMRNIQGDDTIAERDQTSVFKAIMMQLGMTKTGCYTYARNVRMHLSGGDAYSSNKKWNKKRAAELRVQRAEEVAESDNSGDQVEPEQKDIEQLNRWCVRNKDTKQIVNSFTTRTAAQAYNKKLKEAGENTQWFDKQKTA